MNKGEYVEGMSNTDEGDKKLRRTFKDYEFLDMLKAPDDEV